MHYSVHRRPLRDDVDHFECHHNFAGLIDYLDERGDRAAIRLDFEGTALSTVTRTDRVSPGRTGLTQRNGSLFRDFIVSRGSISRMIWRLFGPPPPVCAAHTGSTCRSTITGSVKVNIEPWPG